MVCALQESTQHTAPALIDTQQTDCNARCIGPPMPRREGSRCSAAPVSQIMPASLGSAVPPKSRRRFQPARRSSGHRLAHADASGLNAMRQPSRGCPAGGTQVVCTDGLPEAFDAADLEREGWSDPAAWLKRTAEAYFLFPIWRSKDGDFPYRPARSGPMPTAGFMRQHSRGRHPSQGMNLSPLRAATAPRGCDATELNTRGPSTGLILPDPFSLNNCGRGNQPPLRRCRSPDQVKKLRPVQYRSQDQRLQPTITTDCC